MLRKTINTCQCDEFFTAYGEGAVAGRCGCEIQGDVMWATEEVFIKK